MEKIRAGAGWMLLALGLLLVGCQGREGPATGGDFSERPVRVVATTSMLADLVENVGGERVEVTGLMGPGVDPHLYRASEGDVARMTRADVVFYNGLDLEGRMTDVFARMQQRGRRTVAVAEESVPPEQRLASPDYAGSFDPHIWFDVRRWIQAAEHVQQVLAEIDTLHDEAYAANLARYREELEELDAYVREQAERVPEEQRVLITSHDAFGYFGDGYGFEVRGLQGISTESEAGTGDVQRLADFIAERRIPALFPETSISSRGLEAVREAVRARGFDVQLGGTLYGDALGRADTPEGTYIGAMRHNIDTIAQGLLRDDAVTE